MEDFFEIDFLPVGDKKSGDAICLRYSIGGKTSIHVIDGGYEENGVHLVSHIRDYYGEPNFIDHVVLTHPDQDHASGLAKVLESFNVGTLWMFRPWIYVEALIKADIFKRWENPENLSRYLKEKYPYAARLEAIAVTRGITIKEPFQGECIGAFKVTSPDRGTYWNLFFSSDKTPQVNDSAHTEFTSFSSLNKILSSVSGLVKAIWGNENGFPADGTSAENNMSVVQFSRLNDLNIMLTGDAGRERLQEAWNYTNAENLNQGERIHRFQVPHHGGRHNLDTETLDMLFGKRKSYNDDQASFTAVISAAKNDSDHPRKVVVRSLIHRGARVLVTKRTSLCIPYNAPHRDGWGPASSVPYPEEQEK